MSDPRADSVEASYREMYARDASEFVLHYETLTKLVGQQQSHIEAVSDHASTMTWRYAYRSFGGRLIRLIIWQMLALAFLFWQNAPVNVLALAPVAFTFIWLGRVRIVQHFLDQGAEVLWEKHPVAVKRFLNEVFGKLEEKAQKKMERDQ